MQRGPKPKPKAVLKIRGSRRVSQRDGEPEPPLGIPDAPDFLDDLAKRKWDEKVKQIYQMGILAEIDNDRLGEYCVAYSEYVKALANVRKYGAVLKSQETGQYFQNPYLAVVNKQQDKMLRIGALFGLSPADRARIGKEMNEKPDAKSRFFKSG